MVKAMAATVQAVQGDDYRKLISYELTVAGHGQTFTKESRFATAQEAEAWAQTFAAACHRAIVVMVKELHDEAVCGCGHTCSTHPDAGYSLDGCGDCGVNTCPDCRVEDAAGRCSHCAAKFYGRGGDGDVFEGDAR